VPYYSTEVLNPIDSAQTETPVVELPKFQLLDQFGNVRDESLFKGKVSVVGFLFTSCKGFCPFVLEGMKKVARNASKDVQFVAFTVDPEHDTSAELLDYATKRGLDPKQWVLLTGEKEVLTSIAKKTFASQTFQKPSVERDFVHSEHLYIIDESGKLRGIVNGTRTDVDADSNALIGRLISQSKSKSVE
jgi:protein SCO1/2